MATSVRVYEIATSNATNLNNNEICNETTANATTGHKMWAGKSDDGTITRWLALDQNAQVADLTVTGDVAISSGSITIDALSLSTAQANRVLYGDFAQSSTFLWQNSKLRIGSTLAPVNQVDVTVTSEDGIRVENTGSAATHPLLVFEKTSSSPADNDGIGKIIYRGYDGNQSSPVKRDYITIAARSTDVSAISADYTINIMRQGVPEAYVFSGDSLTIPRAVYFSRWGGLITASVYGNEIGWAQAGAVQNTWYNISDSDITDSLLHGITHDGNGKLTVAQKGYYDIGWYGAFEASAGGVHIQVAPSINSEAPAGDAMNHFETTAVNRQDPCSGTGHLLLNVGDTVEMAIRTTDAGTPNLAIDHIGFKLTFVGGWSI